MPDERLPKKILYGELQVGKRSHGGQKKRYSDTLKASLKDFSIPTCFYTRMRRFVQSLLQAGKKHLAQQFNFTYKYIDDVLSLKNTKFAEYLELIYPRELEKKKQRRLQPPSHTWNVISTLTMRLATRLYNKRDDFNFPIINFPFLSSNIPSAPAYGVYVSQLIRYARACSNYQDVMERGKVLTTRLLSQGYQKTYWYQHLRSSLGDIMIWSISTMWQFPELFLVFFPLTRLK